MLNKRQQLQQQQLIYGGSISALFPVRGVRYEAARYADPPKRQVKEPVSLPSTNNKNNGAHAAGAQKSSSAPVPQKSSDAKLVLPRGTDFKNGQKPPAGAADPKGDGAAKAGGRGGRSRRRPPMYIPPIHYGEKHVPRNIVTIDTSKARGNTDVVRLVARDLGWREFPVPRRDIACDVIWNAISFNDQADVYSGIINKFPGSLDVFHKVNLFRQLMLMKQLFPDQYDFFPRTWALPAQFHEFSNDVRQMLERKPKPKPTFIVKPSEGAQGDGIYLVRDPQGYTPHASRSHVAQEYLTNVLLIDGFKFDLRVYVLVKQLDPLEVHICTEGLARFSTLPYEMPTNRNLHEQYMHLTNYSLNKRSANFNKSEKEDEGSKRKMTAVFRRMERMGHDTAVLWKEIEGIVCKTMIAVAGELRVEYQAAMPPGKPHPSCFQVLGFDILIMKDLKPILLEVNSNPSLSITAEQEVAPGITEYTTSAKDEDVKRALLRDTLILIAPKNKYTRKRRRRRRRHHRQTVEEMDVDPTPSPPTAMGETKHRNHRERDVTIRFTGDDKGGSDGGSRQRSIFAESDKARPVYQRQETCRVFVEGEGEVTNFNTPPYYQAKENVNANANANDEKGGGGGAAGSKASSSSRDTFFMDMAERNPSVFQRSKSERPAEAFMEDDGPSLRPLPYELSLVESSEDENDDDEQSCLKEIFPAVYAEDLRPLQVAERLAELFITCLGIRGCQRMGPTAFRMFARKCRLNRKGLNNASIDILYIDMQRKWEYLNPDRTSGLCYQGFVDACIEIARRKFSSTNPSEPLNRLIAYCEDSLRDKSKGMSEEEEESRNRERLSPRVLRRQQKSVTLFPRRTITSLEEASVQDLFNTAMSKRQRYSVDDVNNFIRDLRHKTYVPSAMVNFDKDDDLDEYEYE